MLKEVTLYLPTMVFMCVASISRLDEGSNWAQSLPQMFSLVTSILPIKNDELFN